MIQRHLLVIFLYWRLACCCRRCVSSKHCSREASLSPACGWCNLPTASQSPMNFVLTWHLLLHHLVIFHQRVSLPQLSSKALEMFLYFPYPSYNLGNTISSLSFMSLYILRDTRQKIPPIHIFQIYQESSPPAKSAFGSPRARTALRWECKWNVLVLQHLYFKLIFAKESYSMGQYHGFQFSVSTSPQIIILEL